MKPFTWGMLAVAQLSISAAPTEADDGAPAESPAIAPPLARQIKLLWVSSGNRDGCE